MKIHLQSNYLTCGMIGRLGNQMFQIANVYAQGLRHNRQVLLPRAETSVSDHYNTVFRKLKFDLLKSTDNVQDPHIIDSTFTYTEYEPHPEKVTIFRGYYQSEKFFQDYSENIKWLFEPPANFINECYENFSWLGSSKITVINVRRGDYLTQPDRHPVVSKEYIQEGIRLLDSETDIFLVISDDIDWCKENIINPKVIFSDYTVERALWLMTLADNFIISNSTFSWWGAWLCQNKDKKVVAPGTWFGPNLTEDTRDIYCEDWIKVPTYWKDGIICLS